MTDYEILRKQEANSIQECKDYHYAWRLWGIDHKHPVDITLEFVKRILEDKIKSEQDCYNRLGGDEAMLNAEIEVLQDIIDTITPK